MLFCVVSCLLLGIFILLLQFDLSGDKSREGGRRRWHGNLSVGCYWTLFFKLETDRPDLCQECNTIAVSNEISSSIHNIVIVLVLWRLSDFHYFVSWLRFATEICFLLLRFLPFLTIVFVLYQFRIPEAKFFSLSTLSTNCTLHCFSVGVY